MSAIPLKVLIPLTLGVWAAMLITNDGLVTELSPEGIVSYQVCRHPDICVKMLESWTVANIMAAAFNLGLDFLFILLYPIAIGLVAIRVGSSARFKKGFFGSLGVFLGWLQVVSYLADSVETGLQAHVLFKFAQAKTSGSYSTAGFIEKQGHFHELIFCLAVVKYVAITPGLLYLLVALIMKVANVGGEKKKSQ